MADRPWLLGNAPSLPAAHSGNDDRHRSRSREQDSAAPSTSPVSCVLPRRHTPGCNDCGPAGPGAEASGREPLVQLDALSWRHAGGLASGRSRLDSRRTQERRIFVSGSHVADEDLSQHPALRRVWIRDCDHVDRGSIRIDVVYASSRRATLLAGVWSGLAHHHGSGEQASGS